MIVITESWCNDQVSNAFLQLKNYYLVPELRIDRSDTARGIGGGILVYVKDNLHILAHDQKSDFIQYCSFTLVNEKQQKVTVFVVYRSPNSSEDNSEKLCELISDASNRNCIFIGDFNYPKINWQSGNCADKKSTDFYNTLCSNNFDQVINYPTHIKGNILDLVFSNDPDLIVYTKPIGRIGKSDHEMIEIGLNFSTNTNQLESTYFDWNRANFSEMNEHLNSIDWQTTLVDLSVEESWEKIKSEILHAQRMHVPERKSKRKNQPDWMDTKTLRLVRKKRRQWKKYKISGDPDDLKKYKETETTVKKEVRKAKRRYEVKLSKKTNNKNAQFRNYVKSKTVTKNPIGPLLDTSGDIVSDNKGMADLLNTFFSSVFTREDQANVPSLPAEDSIHVLDSVQFTIKDIEDRIVKLKDSSAPGPDLISAKLLKSVIHTVAKPLQMLFNKSMSTGTVPKEWKDAIVIPIFKKGTKGSPGNYRPVSLTSIPCKIMESIIKDEIVRHLETNNLMKPSQHGFTKKRSVTTNLLEFFEFVTKTVDEGQPVDIIYLDFSKAFDKVPKLRLIEKIKSKSISGNIVKWISDWLTNRRQKVKVGDSFSQWESVDSGVPQGSVFGPEGFRIYIDDLDDVIKMVDMANKFADDSKVAKIIRNIEDIKLLQTALNGLMEWADRWGMRFNIDKCKVIHVGRTNPKHKYFMGTNELAAESFERDIGVIINESLKPHQQCQKAANAGMGVLNQILRAFTYRDKQTYVNLYKTYVRPHLEFASPAWNPWAASDIEKLEKVQIKFVKQITCLQSSTYSDQIKDIGLTTLEARRRKTDLIETFKIIQGYNKVDRKIWFELNCDTERRTTRSSDKPNNIVKNRTNMDVRKHFFSQRVVDPWNSLPEEIQNATSVANFKKMYDEHIKLV